MGPISAGGLPAFSEFHNYKAAAAAAAEMTSNMINKSPWNKNTAKSWDASGWMGFSVLLHRFAIFLNFFVSKVTFFLTARGLKFTAII